MESVARVEELSRAAVPGTDRARIVVAVVEEPGKPRALDLRVWVRPRDRAELRPHFRGVRLPVEGAAGLLGAVLAAGKRLGVVPVAPLVEDGPPLAPPLARSAVHRGRVRRMALGLLSHVRALRELSRAGA